MLKNLDPLLTPDLLYILRAMGHGDDLVLVDCNFPADSVAQHTVSEELVRLDGVDVPSAARAILSVYPLDTFVDAPVHRMEVVGEPDTIPEVQQEVQALVNEASGRDWPMGSIERMEFYEHARRSYAVVSTGERRGYGCFILKKGIILPDGSAG